MASDARVRYTKKVIRDAFLSLLQEKSVKQMVCCFLERGGSGVLEYWIKTGMEQRPEIIAQLIFRLSSTIINSHRISTLPTPPPL